MKKEKQNKILKVGEIESLFGKNQGDSQKKASTQIKNSENRSSNQQFLNPIKVESKFNVNMFTEGISYEKIDHNKYNKALSNLNYLFAKDKTKNNNQKKVEKIEKTGQISKKYLYERALYKEIEIEIKLNKKSIDNDMISLKNYFLNENNFIYYEYSNSRNITFNKLSEGDMLSYRYFYKNYDNINIDNNLFSNKEEYIKQLDYVNTLNNLFFKYNINKKLFYIITPLYAYSFDYNKNIPLLLTSSKSLETQLKKQDINIIKINVKNKNSSEKRKNSINKNTKKENAETKNNINDMNDNDKSEEDEEELEVSNAGVPIGISQLYVGLFYNLFVNNNALKPFNIFSNFEFEGGIFRRCKTHIIKINRNGENNTYERVNIKIEGIIFEENIINIIDYFRNKLENSNYNIRLNKIRSTGNFYKKNKDDESSFERFEYKDNYKTKNIKYLNSTKNINPKIIYKDNKNFNFDSFFRTTSPGNYK